MIDWKILGVIWIIDWKILGMILKKILLRGHMCMILYVMTMKNLCIRDAKIYKFVDVLKLFNLKAKMDAPAKSFNELLELCSNIR
jgi:hypothetical protein